MKQGIQKELEMIGKYGCGFLCVLQIFNISELEIVAKYRECVERDIITEDCFVKDWVKLFTYLSPIPAKYRVEISDTYKKCDFYLEYWYSKKSKLHHFTLKDYDPLGFSNTVKDGEIESYRLVWCEV